MTDDWVTSSIVLIEVDGVVPVPARLLTRLISYALAGPSTDVTRRLRDEAVDAAHRAIVEAYRRG